MSATLEAALLDAVDAAPWDLVEGVGGDALEAGEAMRALVQGDERARTRAYHELLQSLVVGPGWTDAGALAAPLLVDLARIAGHPAGPLARVLLAELVAGDHVPRLLDGLDLADANVAAAFAGPPAGPIVDVVRAALDDLAAGLDDESPRVRASTAFLLAFFSERAARSWDEVTARATVEHDPWAWASQLIAGAHLARYQARPLRASELLSARAAHGPAPAIVRAAAWLAELYSDRGLRAVEPDELTPDLRDDLLAFVSAGDPPVDLFPWGRGHLDRVVAWPLLDRGEAGREFVAGVLARVAREGRGDVERHAHEALRACFVRDEDAPEPPRRTAVSLSEGQRAVIATLSDREYGGVAFATFGLPPLAWDRRRWLRADRPSVLEAAAPDLGGAAAEVWHHLVAARGRPRPDTLGADRQRVLATIEWLFEAPGRERLEALALVAVGSYGLFDTVGVADVIASAKGSDEVACAWATEWLPRLAENAPEAARSSGVGTAAVWALLRASRDGGNLIAEAYDKLVSSVAPAAVFDEVLSRLPEARREAIVAHEGQPGSRARLPG
jgi:hypothetical protein